MKDGKNNSYSDWTSLAKTISPETKSFVNGAFVDSVSGSTFDVINPATEELLASVSECGKEDVDRAVKIARQAYESGVWSNLSPRERKDKLLCLADLMERDAEELMLLESLDIGKSISEVVHYDVPESIRTIRWTAESLDKLYGEVAPTGPNTLALVTRNSLGVVGAVTPWNYPLMIACWKIAPALAMGNSVILKPAEQTPLTALKLAALTLEAGIPKGVFNVLPGFGPTAGKALGEHSDVDVITFTGSTAVGKLFMQYSGSSNLKRVSLECGGKSPNIVFADADDLEAAAKTAAAAIFISQGQVCVAGSRLLVESSIAEKFTNLVHKAAESYVPGDPLDPETKFGAIVSDEQLKSVSGYVDSGIKEGANLLLGGKKTSVNKVGNFMEATIFNQVKPTMKIATEEIFGPVLSIISFDNEKDAIRIANNSRYGLAAAVWTSSLDRAHRVSAALEAGTVWVNCYGDGDITVPLGGFKQSGFGSDKSLHAFDKFSDLKTTWIALKKPSEN